MPIPPPTPPPKANDPAQSQRFIDMAREVEADEAADALERSLEKVISAIPTMEKRET